MTRYADLIDATLRRALTDAPVLVPLDALGLALAAHVVGAWREVPRVEDFADRAGNRRRVYAGLAAYALALLGVEPSPAPAVELPVRAATSAKALGALWQHLACVIRPASRCGAALDAWLATQRPDGALLAVTADDHPEPAWYDELVLTHLACSYAAVAPHALPAALRAANRLAREVQPDHASLQPWAVAPMLLAGGDGVALADFVLGASGAAHPGGLDGVSLILLADALRCLRVLEPSC